MAKLNNEECWARVWPSNGREYIDTAFYDDISEMKSSIESAYGNIEYVDTDKGTLYMRCRKEDKIATLMWVTFCQIKGIDPALLAQEMGA